MPMRLTLATAVAMTGMAFATGPVAAATPMVPLAPPACEKYEVPGFSNLIVGQTVMFVAWKPDGTGGSANYNGFGSNGTMGQMTGGLKGTHADFTINWDQGPDAGTSSHFVGDVRDNLSLDGNVRDQPSGAGGLWHLDGRVECIGPGAAANKPPTQATVDVATDIYDKPDGKGQRIGTLEVGEVHPLMEPCRDDWCRVGAIELGGFDGLPNGTAWVYSKGYLTFS